MSLILQDVKKSYREPGGTVLPILNIARFELADGEQMALLGPSGGGKTTLLNVISGITAPDSGSVTIDGVDIAKLHEVGRDRFRARKIGFVFQTFNLLPAFTALENVLVGMTFAAARAGRAGAPLAPSSAPDVGGRTAAGGGRPGVGEPSESGAGR
jgi:putative ABC transport system ATP-binding protein